MLFSSFWKRGPGPPLWGPGGVLGPLDPPLDPPQGPIHYYKIRNLFRKIGIFCLFIKFYVEQLCSLCCSLLLTISNKSDSNYIHTLYLGSNDDTALGQG